MMIHPRLPPLVRALPSYGSLALVYDEEGKEERSTRESLGLRQAVEGPSNVDEDVNMQDVQPQPVPVNAPPMTPSSPIISGRNRNITELVNNSSEPKSAFAAPTPENTRAIKSAPFPQEVSGTLPAANTVTITQVTEEVVEQVEDRTLAPEQAVEPFITHVLPPIVNTSKPAVPQLVGQETAKANTREAISMAVDSEEDFEFPALNMESDTDDEEL